MLARKKTSKQGKVIPLDWSEGVGRLLNETYKNECDTKERYFDVYGQVFSEELLLITSYLSEKDPARTPITLYLSSEASHIENEAKVKATQKDFIDLTGLFFDEIFGNEEWNDFEPEWQEVTHNNQTYFYKLTRENVSLTLEANKLLGDEFFDIDEDFNDEDEEQNH